MAQAWCEALHLACSDEHAAKESCTARVRVYTWESALTMQHRAAGLLRGLVLIPLVRQDGLFMPLCIPVQCS